MGEPERIAVGTVTIAAGTRSTTPMRRVAAACLVGSAIEFYDFLIYGTAAALVFSHGVLPAPQTDAGHDRLDGDICDGVPVPAGRRGASSDTSGTGWAAKRRWSPRC